jgi:DNA-binding transcriptional LysR family regulator
MRFTLRQLSYFAAAAETGSVRAASERVHISQPAVSAAISALEEEFGVQLFIRQHAQGLSLTSAGEQFMVAAQDLLRKAQGVNELANEITSRIAGPLRVGIFRTYAPLLIPELCIPFLRANPHVLLETVEQDEAALFAQLRKGLLDRVISYQQPVDDIHFEPLAKLSTYVLLAADHPLASHAELSLADLADEVFVLLDLPISREYFRSLFARRGVPMRIAASFDQPETVRSYVAAGIGFSLMTARPTNRVALTGRPLAYVPLNERFEPMVLGLASLKNVRPTRAALAFEAHCRAIVSDGALLDF